MSIATIIYPFPNFNGVNPVRTEWLWGLIKFICILYYFWHWDGHSLLKNEIVPGIQEPDYLPWYLMSWQRSLIAWRIKIESLYRWQRDAEFNMLRLNYWSRRQWFPWELVCEHNGQSHTLCTIIGAKSSTEYLGLGGIYRMSSGRIHGVLRPEQGF